MDLTHRFTVPTSVDDTWAHFADIASVAECFPGAAVSSVEGDSFSGSVKVKLGPIALVYNGSGTFLDKDEANHSMKIEAKGKDKRGNGTAGANVTATMTGSGDSTDVVVVTDLSITGKPAQFGRGVMQDVSDKLLGQFVACVERKLGGGDQEPAEPAAAAAPVESAPAAPAESAPSDPAAAPSDPAPAPLPPPAPQPATDDALDLGATVLPVLAKTYWRQALGALLVLAFLIRAMRKRS